MKPRRLVTKDRKLLNREISNLVSPGNKTQYFDAIPLDELFAVCQAWDLEPLQEDNTPWNGLLCGAEGMATLPLGDSSSVDHVTPETTLEPVTGGALTFTWYKMQSGRYEIVAYVN